MLMLLSLAALASEPMLVGVEHSPPFAIKENGQWSGISVDLWDTIAKENRWEYTLVEQPFSELLIGVQRSELDVALPAITVTSQRETKMDFSHTYLVEDIAVATNVINGPLDISLQIFNRLIGPLTVLMTVLGIAGVFYFLTEKLRQGSRGLFDSVYWALTTMVTVGYGDEAPKSIPGRIFAMIWMFTALFIFASINAQVLGVFAAITWTPQIKDLSDLRGETVVTVRDSFSDELLTNRQVKHTTVATEQEMIAQLGTQKGFAVYDRHILLAFTKSEPKIQVLPGNFYAQHLAFAVKPDFMHLDQLNISLLSAIDTPWWKSTVFKYTEGE